MEKGPLTSPDRGSGESGAEPDHGPLAGAVRSASLLRRLHSIHPDPLAVPKPVPGGLPARAHMEVRTALLRAYGGRPDLLRRVMVHLRPVFAGCVADSRPERSGELRRAESVLLHILRTRSPAEGERRADKKESDVQSREDDGPGFMTCMRPRVVRDRRENLSWSRPGPHSRAKVRIPLKESVQ